MTTQSDLTEQELESLVQLELRTRSDFYRRMTELGLDPEQELRVAMWQGKRMALHKSFLRRYARQRALDRFRTPNAREVKWGARTFEDPAVWAARDPFDATAFNNYLAAKLALLQTPPEVLEYLQAPIEEQDGEESGYRRRIASMVWRAIKSGRRYTPSPDTLYEIRRRLQRRARSPETQARWPD